MTGESIRILYIEDDEDHAILFMEMLSAIDSISPVVVHKKTLQTGIEALSRQEFDVVILDLGLPESRGLETLSRFLNYGSYLPIVVLTTTDDLQLSVAAIKAGAQDFLVKSEISANAIARSIRYAIERFGILNELEEKNENLNTFATAASHDLKTPLRNISLTIDFFRADHSDELTTDGHEALDKIQTSVSRLHSLVDSLMEFTKAGAKLSTSGAFPIKTAVEEAVTLLAREIEASRARITMDEHFPDVQGNYRLLVRVFQNLIDNAIKYSGDKPPDIHVGAKETPGEFVFSVTDKGIGVEEQYFEKIFEPLKRLHNQQKYPGSGIGLAVCKRIVTSHGGRIWVQSTPGQGSTFFFTLPKKNRSGGPGTDVPQSLD